jgi:hypothetical protein
VSPPKANEFVLVTSGTYTGKRKVATYTAGATPQIAWTKVFSGNIASGVTYELHTFDPDLITDALNWARVDAYPYVGRVLDNTTIFTQENVHKYTLPSTVKDVRQVYLGNWVGADVDENLLSNGDFEDWTGAAPDDWDTPTNITTAKESNEDFVMKGDYSCKCTGTSSAGSIYQTVSTPSTYSGMRVSLQVHVYCRTATRLKASIYDTSANEGSYHSGNGWEWLEVSYNVPASPTLLKGGVTCLAGTAITFYIDEAILTISDMPVSTPGQPVWHWRQVDNVLEFIDHTPPAFRPIRIVGTGYATAVSADTDTMEIDAPQTDILYAGALTYLYKQLMSGSGSLNMPAATEKLGEWLGFYELYKRTKSVSIPTMIRVGRNPL